LKNRIKEFIEIAERISASWQVEPPFQSILPSQIVNCYQLILVQKDLQKLNNFIGEAEVISMWITMLDDTVKNILQTLREMVPKITDDDFREGLSRLGEDWERIIDQ
jgi:hypothetical protein